MRENYNYDGAKMAKHVKIWNNGGKMEGFSPRNMGNMGNMTQLESCVKFKWQKNVNLVMKYTWKSSWFLHIKNHGDTWWCNLLKKWFEEGKFNFDK